MILSPVEWVQAVGTGAGFLTALAALFTVRQLRDQRRTQFKPDLVVDDTLFRVYASGNAPESTLPQVVVAGRMPDLNLLSRGSLFLRLRNVGIGTAKDTGITLTFDAQAFAEQIAALDPELGKSFETSKRLVLTDNDGGTWGAVREETVRLGALAADATSPGAEVHFPFAYVRMFATCLMALRSALAPASTEDWAVPPLEITVTYRDLEDVIHRKRLLAHVELSHLMGPRERREGEPEWSEIGGGGIEVRDA